MRQRGEDVFFLTGTDEHGEPIELAAEREGVSPQELADRNAPKFEELAQRVDATNDFFIRTSDPAPRGEGRRRSCSGSTTTATSTRASTRAGTARAAPTSRPSASSGPGNTCPIHEIPLEREREENWFFRLSSFRGPPRGALRRAARLRACPTSAATRRSPSSRAGSRTSRSRGRRLKWGMPLPWDPEPADVRVVRRAAQLRHRAVVRARGRGPDRALLAGDAPRPRQGHPQVPRRHLARPLLRRRPRAAAAAWSSTASC